MSRPLDLNGQRYGRLVVIEKAPNKGQQTYWLCRCDCGKETVVRGSHLRNGKIKSCGCYQKELSKERIIKHSTTHQKTHTRLYGIWHTMKNRCFNTKHKDYASHGGRGITVCEEWKNDFTTFHNWAMSHGYAENLTLDRIDNSGNYCPDNCRWATRKEQANNRRNNHYVTYNGERLTISQFADRLGLNYKYVANRIIRNKWSVEDFLKATE